MVKRYRRNSYDYDYDRDSEAPSYHSFRPRSPPQSEWRDSKHIGPATKTWVNPNLQAKSSTPWRDNASNRYNDSRNFREDSRSLRSENRSRSPHSKFPPSPPSPPSKRPSNQLSNHSRDSPSDLKPLPPSSKLDLSIYPPGNATERSHVGTEGAPEKGSSPGFNIRGRSAVQSDKIDIGNAIRGLNTESAAMGPNPPNGFHIPVIDAPTEDPPQLELMMNHLSRFAQTLSTHASLTNEQEAAEAKLAKVQQEREKWRNYHSSFVSLSEDQEKEIRDHKATLTRIRMKQREHLKVQEDAIRLMATTLLATQANNPLPTLDGKPSTDKFSARLEALEAQVPTVQGAAESNAWETKSKLNELQKAQETMTADLQNFKSNNTESQRSLSKGFDDKIAEVRSRISDMDVPLVFTRQINDFGLDLAAVRGKIKDLSKLEAAQDEMSGKLYDIGEDVRAFKLQKPTYDGLAEKLDTLNGDFRRLHIEVAGDDPENPGLLTMLENFEENLNQVREEVRGVHQSIAIVQDDVDEINKTHTSSEPLQNSTSVKQQSEESSLAVSQRLDKLELILKKDYATLQNDAETRDNMVAAEIGEMEKRVTSLSDQSQDLRQTVTELQNKLGFQTVNGAETRTLNGVHAVELNGVSHTHNPLNAPYNPGSPRPLVNDVSTELREHRSILESHYNFIADLQSKFNNLTSDEIAGKMTIQMQKLYPFASSVQNDMAGIKANLNHLQAGLNQLHAATYTLDSQAKHRAHWDAETRQIVESVRNDLITLQATVATANDLVTSHNTQLDDHESRLTIQGEDVIKYNQAFENVKSEATQQLATLGESLTALEKKLGSVESDARKETAKMHSKVSLMWNERPKEHAKMMSPVTTSPKSASPTASPSAPASPRKIIKMRLKDKNKEKKEDDAVTVAEDEEDEDPIRIRKRPRVETN